MPPNPDELKVRPDEHGKIRFNFRGQPWLDVLNWLAEVSDMSLDWTELPPDFLNLTTQRSYSVEEARDLVNRHLLARGFTLLENGEVLNVVNLKKLDAGLVPRVQPSDLLKRRPNEFVKVSFALDWLVAEAAVEELKPMLSPNGKLSALKSTNRIEAIDTVVNLRDIYKVLGDEQSNDGQERLVREFELQHAKASEVAQQLQKLLGIEDKSAARGAGGGQMNPEQQQQMMMQQQQMMQQMQQQGRGGATPPGGPKQAAEISLVVNARRNSILALAPPDKIAIITQAVKMLDVPTERGHSLLANLGRMQVYRLAQLDPAALVKMLEESGGLDPTTRLQIDNSNKAIIAHASLADHMLVRQVIEKLDGSGRKFEVIQLRRLEADHVAGTIEFMMSGSGDDKQQQSQRNYGYYDYFGGGGRSGRQETEKDKFRVDADVENNRLLLWANGIELEEVNNLLVKLGEIPDRRGKASTTRVLNIEPGLELDELLDKLRRVWPSLAPNPLLLPEGRESLVPKTTEPPKAKVDEPPGDAPVRPASRARSAALPVEPARPRIVSRTTIPIVQLAQLEPTPPADDNLQADDEPSAKPRELGRDDDADAPPLRRPASETANAPPPPPVRVSISPDGRIVVSSEDPAALDLIEEIAAILAPERKDYHVFKLKNAPVLWVKFNLQDYFEEDKDKKNSGGRNYYFSDYPPTAKQESRHRLSKRKSLRFISDTDTNTILVQGADAAQLKIIKELIELYDQPEPTNAKAARVTTVVPVKWSKAQVIAEAVKDVYRDLLSSLDKALAQSPDQKQKPASQNTYIFGGEDEEGGKEKKTQVTFKGKLSIGVDELSNTLLVSAEGENLLANVTKMIRLLDEAAR